VQSYRSWILVAEDDFFSHFQRICLYCPTRARDAKRAHFVRQVSSPFERFDAEPCDMTGN
jgi:hypothetical protein